MLGSNVVMFVTKWID